MSFRLVLDEDTQAARLIAGLREAGHDVMTASEADLVSASDKDVLAFATSEKRIVLTRNCTDFIALHTNDPVHMGIICVFMDDDPRKDMSYVEIVRAIDNLDAYVMKVNWTLVGEFIPLNPWK
jgi:hypothetical protein